MSDRKNPKMRGKK